MDGISTLCLITFIVCLALVLYAYALYPFIILLMARWFGRDPVPPPLEEHDLPTVSFLIAAHNEEAVIEERIHNLLAIDYPRDRLEIVIASDGSTDATAAIVSRFQSAGVRLLDYRVNRGKTPTLNAAIPQLKGEIVVLSDANTSTDPAAVRKLVRWFKDPQVGAVCGRLMLVDASGSKNADGLYWKFENLLKTCEARLGGLLGANGAIYAVRRSLYTPIPSNTIVDDLVIPLWIKQRTGCAIVYDHEAVAREETPPNVEDEFRRRTRIGAGGFQSIAILWPLLLGRGWISFTFFSHKIVRWLCPFALLGMLVSNLFLIGRPLFAALLMGQVVFFMSSLLFLLVPVRGPLFRPFRLATMFTLMNGALLMGFFRWCRGIRKATWSRTPREA